MKTIIFLNGFMVPMPLAKSSWVWHDSLWEDYNRIYLPSKTPLSDKMVDKELDKLCDLTHQYNNPIVAGHSLGAWWAANLACHPHSNISKLVFFTPLLETSPYPIFNVSDCHNPNYKTPNKRNTGYNKCLVLSAGFDFIVPAYKHSYPLLWKFNATHFPLNGGHFYQFNHYSGLQYMKDWLK